MQPVSGERYRVLRLEHSGKKRVGERASGGNHHRSVTQLRLVVEDLLELIGGQLRPVTLRDHDWPLDHDGSIKGSRGGAVDAERQETIALLRRIIAYPDVLVERPSMPGNDVSHNMSSSELDKCPGLETAVAGYYKKSVEVREPALLFQNPQLPGSLIKSLLTGPQFVTSADENRLAACRTGV